MLKSLRYTVAGLSGLACVLGAQAEVRDNPAFNITGLVIVWSADPTDGTPLVSDFIIADGQPGGSDLIATDAFTVVTGSLVSTQDTTGLFGGIPYVISNTAGGDLDTDSNGDGNLTVDDSISAFNLNPLNDTRVDAVSTRSSFYVASNTAFNVSGDVIDEQSDIVGIDLSDFILLEMSVTEAGTDAGLAFGGAAQTPHSGGATAGFNAPNPRILSTLDNGAVVFEGNRATAASPGTILEQSVRFDQVYSIGFGGYDLAFGTFDFSATVLYTVFVP